MNLAWTDSQFSSRRSDGALVGGFVIDGRVEWWAHPQGISTKDGRANGIGPFPTRELAKRALDPEEVQAWTTAPIPFPDAQPSALSQEPPCLVSTAASTPDGPAFSSSPWATSSSRAAGSFFREHRHDTHH